MSSILHPQLGILDKIYAASKNGVCQFLHHSANCLKGKSPASQSCCQLSGLLRIFSGSGSVSFFLQKTPDSLFLIYCLLFKAKIQYLSGNSLTQQTLTQLPDALSRSGSPHIFSGVLLIIKIMVFFKNKLFPLPPPEHTPAPSAFCASLPLSCPGIPEGKAHSLWQSAPVSSLQKSFFSRICDLSGCRRSICLSRSILRFLIRQLRNHYVSRKSVKLSHLQLNLCTNSGIIL